MKLTTSKHSLLPNCILQYGAKTGATASSGNIPGSFTFNYCRLDETSTQTHTFDTLISEETARILDIRRANGIIQRKQYVNQVTPLINRVVRPNKHRALV
jgi:hypothetical protein